VPRDRARCAAGFCSATSAGFSGTWATATGCATRWPVWRHAALAPTLLLTGFSLVLGLYFGLFGWALRWCGGPPGARGWALAAAPVLWAALELRLAHYFRAVGSAGLLAGGQHAGESACAVDGVYGISFVLVAVNALIAGGSC
jgi:hypothetical protein